MDWWESHEPNCHTSHFDRGTGTAAFAVSTDGVKSARPVTGKPNQKVVKNLRKYLDERFFITVMITKSARGSSGSMGAVSAIDIFGLSESKHGLQFICWRW